MDAEKSKAKPGQYLTFQLKGQTYGFSISIVREINRMLEITPVPKTSRSLLGVMNLRGKVIPVVDLSLQLGLGDVKPTKNTCIIVTESEGGPVGVVVDVVNSVLDIVANQIEGLPSVSQSEETNFVLGLAKIESVVVILVDILMILNKQNIYGANDAFAGAA